MSAGPLIATAGDTVPIGVVGDIYHFLATGEQTDGRYAVFEAIVPPGGGPPPHIHSREVESFYILEGEITVTFGDKRIMGKAGTFIHTPTGVAHAFKNESQNPAKMLITVVPAGIEKMFLEIGVPLPKDALTAPPPTSADIEKILKIAPNYGIEILRPPH
jgi:quercetin dioxygenase-like cupin family protein